MQKKKYQILPSSSKENKSHSFLYDDEDVGESINSKSVTELKWSYIFYLIGTAWIVFSIVINLGLDPFGLTTRPKFVRPRVYTHWEKASLNSTINHSIQPSQIKEPRNQENSETKIILFYNEWYGQPFWLSSVSTVEDFESADFQCPRKCKYTHSKKYMNQADAVIFSIVDLVSSPVSRLHLKQRSSNQIWVGAIFETPTNFHVQRAIQPKILDSFFNWTVSYRRDSDIFWPSGHFYAKHGEANNERKLQDNIPMQKKKRKLAAWLVSNCRTQGKRERIVKKMTEYIPIDIYGKCGDLDCPNLKICRAYLGENYKFYLSFENSLCYDYITEKFYDPFDYNMVPVTYGLGNYKKSAPPHSYINILDFQSVRELTDYLLFLDRNDTEYAKYFRWKKDYSVSNNPTVSGLCNLCVHLWKAHEENIVKYHPSFIKWWTEKPQNEFQTNDDERQNSTFVTSFGRVCSRPREIHE